MRNTVSIFDIFEANQTVYMVMEYLEGCNLKEYQESNRKILPFELVQKMADDICDALVEVHADGIIHRDISPDNIFMCDSGEFKLMRGSQIETAFVIL